MAFTGKFPKENQKIDKEPIDLIICSSCELVQLGHTLI